MIDEQKDTCLIKNYPTEKSFIIKKDKHKNWWNSGKTFLIELSVKKQFDREKTLIKKPTKSEFII